MRRISSKRLRERGTPAPGRPSRHPRRDSGQAIIEVAIALPILLALLIGIFEFARAYNVKQVITNAAREGAREAVLPGKNAGDVTAVVNDRLADAGISSATITLNPADPNIGTGLPVSVTVAVDYTFVFVGPILRVLQAGSDPGTITLGSEATMRKE